MSKFNTIRTGLLGSAAIVSLLTVAPAQAVEAQFGEVSITFDTTVSMGASMLTQERETEFLPEGNGGPVDPRNNPLLGANIVIPGVATVRPGLAGAHALAVGGTLGTVANGNNTYTLNGSNFDGSLNGDDGRLNFNRGDLIGANVKATHDLIIGYQNYKIFARGVGFYDVIMNDKDVGDHSQLTDQALGDVGRNYDLLDLFVSADYTLGDLPVNLRVGKQVINWGESTFIQNGLNVFNPIDVAAIRKPGSEIKEALVPVNSVFASVSFPFQVGLSGWYALDFEPFEIDPAGTPFSGTDVVAMGSGIGGNNSFSFVTASPFGANRRTCGVAGSVTTFLQTNDFDAGTAGVQSLLTNPGTNVGPYAPDGDGILECSDSQYVSNLVRLPNNQHELIRLGQLNGSGGQADLSSDGVSVKTTGILGRGDDHQARDGGQFGLKATWFAEDLNGTEFGFYYQNYHSRLPFANIAAADGPRVGDLSFIANGFNTEAKLSDVGSRALNTAGCGLANNPLSATPGALTAVAGFAPGAAITTMLGAVLPNAAAFGSAAAPGTIANKLANTPVNDSGNLLANAAAAISAITGGAITLHDSADGVPGVGVDNFANQYAVAQLNCVLAYYQSQAMPAATLAPYAVLQPFDNAEFLNAAAGANLEVVYPEDIEIFGFSFNTTVGSWGLQAEATYRPSAPFQVDTDSLTIGALARGCVFQMLRGSMAALIEAQATPDGSGDKPNCLDPNDQASNPIIRNEMFTAQIGTTAQFTGSDWFIDMLGADIGTLVTEVGMVLTPSVEDTWISNGGGNKAQYQNTGCQGTDLPLASLLDLDIKQSAQCRPTDLSAGMTMLFTWSYNNFLDTGFAVAPRLVYSYDFEGTTAAPYSNYLEDRQAINLGVDGTLNNNLRLGVSYSNFFGGHENNKSRDRDFASFSASYSF